MRQKEKKIYTVYLIEYQGEVKYVGKTCDFERRKWEHLHCRGTHNSGLPVDVDMTTIEFKPIETYDDQTDALKREDELIVMYNTINNGWNKIRSGLICVSDVKAYDRKRKHTDEYKARENEWQKRYRSTEEYREKQREHYRKRKQTPEYKAYKKEYDRKRRQTEEYKAYKREYYLRKKAEMIEYQKQYYLSKKAEKLNAQTV